MVCDLKMGCGFILHKMVIRGKEYANLSKHSKIIMKNVFNILNSCIIIKPITY